LLVKARTLKADAMLARGETEPALAEYAAAIQAKPSSREGYLGRACAFYRLERWAEALADLKTARKVNRGQSSDLEDLAVTATLAWLVQTRAGQKGAAAEEVTSFKGVLKDLRKDPAKNHLLALPLYLAGELPEADLIKAAENSPARSAQALCEVHFVIGERKLLAGDAAGAGDHFGRCTAEGLFERDVALQRLKTRDQKR
jgi:tetratricopeptide (TPR) repeat protein